MGDILKGLSMLVAALGFGYVGFGLFRTWESLKWPVITGEITTSEVVRNYDDKGDYKEETRIEYEYKVEYDTYRSNTIKAAGDQGALKLGFVAKSRLRKYPEQRHVSVYYDPEHPERSRLERGCGITIYIALAVCVACTFFAYYIDKHSF